MILDYQLQNSFVTRVCPQIVGVSYVGEQFRILCLIYTMHGLEYCKTSNCTIELIHFEPPRSGHLSIPSNGH